MLMGIVYTIPPPDVHADLHPLDSSAPSFFPPVTRDEAAGQPDTE